MQFNHLNQQMIANVVDEADAVLVTKKWWSRSHATKPSLNSVVSAIDDAGFQGQRRTNRFVDYFILKQSGCKHLWVQVGLLHYLLQIALHKKPGPGRSLSYSIRPYSRSRLHDSHSRFYTTYSRYLSEQSQI
eukprot:Em0084g7a